jgi:hypothetical protein
MLPSANPLSLKVRDQISRLEPALLADFNPAQAAGIDLVNQLVAADAERSAGFVLADQQAAAGDLTQPIQRD